MANNTEKQYDLSKLKPYKNYLVGNEINELLDISFEDISLGGIIEGVVQDKLGEPINGAIVQLMSLTFNPIMHATTDLSGAYKIKNVPIGQILKIYSVIAGKKLEQGDNVILASLGESIQRNFTLEDDPIAKLGLIAGDVFDLNTNKEISQAAIRLYSIDGVENLISIVFTNKYGQFTFRELSLGRYRLNVSSLGYIDKTIETSIINEGQIIPLKIKLDANNSNGTISGIISEENGNIISNGNVILYRVETDNTLTPIAFTKTDGNGVYLFQNVSKGLYKIKSNQFESITIFSTNSPYFYSFVVTDSISFNQIVLPEETILLDGATIEKDINGKSYISNIKQGKGQVKFVVLIPTKKNYNLQLSYSCIEDSSCNIKINDIKIINQKFNFLSTNNSINTEKWSILLNQGYNTFEFYNE